MNQRQHDSSYQPLAMDSRLSYHPVRNIPRVQSYQVVTERTTGRTVPLRTSDIHGSGMLPAERRAPLFGDARYP